MTQVFVTGGSGFLGSHLIETLKGRGDSVRAVARSASAADRITERGGEPVTGDLVDVDALARAMSGCEVVYHVAGMANLAAGMEQLYATNVQGTQNTLDAARKAGVARLIHVSTEQVLMDGKAKVNAAEDWPYPRRPLGLYAVTKGEAERRVLAANSAEFTTVSVRPRWIWGPRDHVLAELVQLVQAKQFFWVSGGKALTATCHVANACHGLILAAERGVGGQAYFVTDGEPVQVREFMTALLAAVGVEARGPNLPFGVLNPLAGAAELAFRVLPGSAPLSRAIVTTLGREFTIDISKARRELGYEPVVSQEQGLAELRGYVTV